MKKAVILHGTLGSPEGNWFGWLKQELEKKELQVWLPQLPDSEKPSLKRWLDFVGDNCPFPIDEETIVVGHSSGGILALLLPERRTVGRIVSVSAFHTSEWEPNNDLFDIPFDWEKLKAMSDHVLHINSDNDPYVALDQAEYIAGNSGAELLIIPGQGHFNLEQSADYKAFPRLLEEMQQRKFL